MLVIVPDPKYGWLQVCDLDQLTDYLAEGDSLQEAVANASLDSATKYNIMQKAEAIRRLNNDENFDYWGLDSKEISE